MTGGRPVRCALARLGLATLVAATFTALAAIPAGAAMPERPANPGAPWEAGARTANDPVFPRVGNGGYDALDYRINLVYAPVRNRFLPGTSTTMTAAATADLWQFSLDFQGLKVTGVEVDGQPSWFTRKREKLIVIPVTPIDAGTTFRARVFYRGSPDSQVEAFAGRPTQEGWLPICPPWSPRQPNRPCAGAMTLGEPLGSQAWFPSNNVPADRATFTTVVRVPARTGGERWVGLGTGELVSVGRGPSGREVWTWREELPTQTYVTTGSVGRFALRRGSFTAPGGRPVQLLDAFERYRGWQQRPWVRESFRRQKRIIRMFSQRFGPYPFTTAGTVVAELPDVQYILENQGRIHFPMRQVPRSILAHEYAHQWFGNAVGPADWSTVWFNEGWANWSEWFSVNRKLPGRVLREHFQRSAGGRHWRRAPARMKPGSDLFNGFATYTRPGMMLEGYRQIVGGQRFFALARQLQTDFAYDNITGAEFVRAALDASGFTGAKRDKLRRYFRQWLYWQGKPQLAPKSFAR